MGATEPLTAMTGKVGGLRLIFAAEVSCTDGHCGRVRLLVVDPTSAGSDRSRCSPGHWREGRLVPVRLVDTASTEVWLRCSRAEFEALQKAEEIDYGPASQTPGMHITAWEYPVDAGDVRMRAVSLSTLRTAGDRACSRIRRGASQPGHNACAP